MKEEKLVSKRKGVAAIVIKYLSVVAFTIYTFLVFVGILNTGNDYYHDSGDLIMQLIMIWIVGSLFLLLLYGVGEIIDLLTDIYEIIRKSDN